MSKLMAACYGSAYSVPRHTVVKALTAIYVLMITCTGVLILPLPTKAQASKTSAGKRLQINQPSQPNIIIILTDDMGLGDLSCYNAKATYATPNIDRMAAQGIRFTKYYSAAPVCSPSRVGLLTGMPPASWHITNYLSNKKHNADCGQSDFLDSAAPTMAKTFRAAGYATGHFGKWHMGGGRDVKNAPSISAYGFDEWTSTWESPEPDPLLTSSNWIWADKDSIRRWNRTAYFIDKTLDFLKKNKGKPCFINLWPDDVHTPWVPDTSFVKNEGDDEKNFIPVLKEYDIQIGRLLDSLRSLGLDKTTLVIFTSDNGPAPNFRHDRSAGLRGTKLSLYEGGIKMPFIAWGAGVGITKVDSTSIITATDLHKSLTSFAKIKGKLTLKPGEDRSGVLHGIKSARKSDIFWEYGRTDAGFDYPRRPGDRSPALAIRSADFKLLMNPDGSKVELYDLSKDAFETLNLVDSHPKTVETLRQKLLAWWSSVN